MVDTGRRHDKLNFKYKTEYVPDEHGREIPIQKPKIQVTFRRFAETKDVENNREFPTFALIDSGADYSHLPLKIASDILRLDIEETDQKILTIAGEAKIFKSKVYVEIPMKGQRPISVGMIDIHIIDKEIDEKHLNKLIVLGRRGFFEKFEITFNEKAKFMTLIDNHNDELRIRK